MADQRRAPEAAADVDGETDLARVVLDDLIADVVHLDRRTIGGRARHRDLELARQEREFRVQRRPLPDDLGIGPGILDLVEGGAGELVGGRVADAVPGGLDAMHLDRGQLVEDGRAILQRGPVELQVLPGREMAVALVVGAGDVRELAHLLRGQRAVRHRNAEHVGVQLQIDAVHQAQRTELLLGERTIEAPRDLIAELRDALRDEIGIELVVTVHVSILRRAWARSA